MLTKKFCVGQSKSTTTLWKEKKNRWSVLANKNDLRRPPGRPQVIGKREKEKEVTMLVVKAGTAAVKAAIRAGSASTTGAKPRLRTWLRSKQGSALNVVSTVTLGTDARGGGHD